MARTEYYDDPMAPAAADIVASAFAVTRNAAGQVLMVCRADDGNWELPGGQIDVGESATDAVIREVAEEAGVRITVTGVSGVYSEPGHVLAYPTGAVRQQLAVSFHAASQDPMPRPDGRETIAACWVDPAKCPGLQMHPTVRRRLAEALSAPNRTHFD